MVKGGGVKNVQNVRKRGKQMGIDIGLFQQYVKTGIIQKGDPHKEQILHKGAQSNPAGERSNRILLFEKIFAI